MAQWLFNLTGQTGCCEIVSDGPLTFCDCTDVLNQTMAICFSLQHATKGKQNGTKESEKLWYVACITGRSH